MRATGIVRRIDDLGRVVIPKEIRRTMRITEGTPLEIFTDTDDTLTLKKYSPVKELNDISDKYADALAEAIGCTIIITDNDTIVSVAHGSVKDYKNMGITTAVAKIIWDRKPKLINRSSAPDSFVKITDQETATDDYHAQCFMPILPDGDAVGCVIAISKTPGKEFNEITMCGVKITAALLAKYMTV